MATCEERKFYKYWADARRKEGSKPRFFPDWRSQYATEAQVQEINDLLVSVYGSNLFNYKTIDEYITDMLYKHGRAHIDLKRNPLTKEEANEIIVDLKKLRARIDGHSGLLRWFEKKLLTPSKFLRSDPITSRFYDDYQKEMARFVKRKITILMSVVSPEKPGDKPGTVTVVEYKKDEDGNVLFDGDNAVVKGRFTTMEISHLLGFEEKTGSGPLAKTEREILKKWVQLQMESAPIEVVDDEGKVYTEISPVALEKLKKFEEENKDVIEKAKFFFEYIEAGGENAKDNPGIPENRLKAAARAWNALMDDIYVYDLETYNRWYKRKSRTGKTYGEMFEDELRRKLKIFAARSPNLTDEKIGKIIERMRLKPPGQRKNYFTHVRAEHKIFGMSDLEGLFKDLESGRITIEDIVSSAKGSQFWLRRTGREGELIYDPITVAEVRIMSSIQVRKNLALRALTLETLELLNGERKSLEKVKDEVLYDKKRFTDWKKKVDLHLQRLQSLEDYVRLLASDAQGLPRRVSRLTESIFGRFTKPGNLDEYVASVSRIYRSYKVSAYLGFSVKAAMVNMQQSIGPVAVEFGFKYMREAQRDMGIFGFRSKREQFRIVMLDDGTQEKVDVVEQVGVKYDDIMSLMERGIPKFNEKQLRKLMGETEFKKFVDAFERGSQKLAQFSLEHSWLGRIINFVDMEYRNRAVTALAAYDYKIDKLKKQGIIGLQAHNTAITFAREAVNRLQFEYSIFNRPEFLRGNLGSAVFLFKSFTVNQTQMQFDWVFEAKSLAFKNSKGVYIDYERIAKLGRAAIFWFLHTMVKNGLKVSIGLLAIESPVLEYLKDLYMLLFGSKEQKQQAFFGMKRYGAVNQLFSGPVSDALNVYIVAADKDLRKRAYQGIWDGWLPGGRNLRVWIGDVSGLMPGVRPGQNKFRRGIGTFFIEPPKSEFDSPAFRLFLEMVAGYPIYDYKKPGLRRLKSGAKMKKLEGIR